MKPKTLSTKEDIAVQSSTLLQFTNANELPEAETTLLLIIPQPLKPYAIPPLTIASLGCYCHIESISALVDIRKVLRLQNFVAVFFCCKNNIIAYTKRDT